MVFAGVKVQGSRAVWEYGYAWFLDKLNRDTRSFRQPSAQYMMFNSPSMQVKRLLHPDHASCALTGKVPLNYQSINDVFLVALNHYSF
jgi:hypothetical protein